MVRGNKTTLEKKAVMDMRFIMNRLLDSPVMKTLKLTSAASYVKDFSSINGIAPIIGYRYSLINIVNYMGEIPDFIGEVKTAWLCGSELNSYLSENDELKATMKISRVPNRDKVEIGNYDIKKSHIHTDVETGVVEIFHSILETDEAGFPILPYDGSLAEAIINYVKYRYFTLLNENDMIADKQVARVHREYTWYIGQYTMKNTIPTHDVAVAWANSWQRLLTDRDQDLDDKSYREILKI